MTFTVSSLLQLPALGTVSLTPGVGEDRRIEWAHVCELPDPWRWLGRNSLVMTTGLGLPSDTAGQSAYLSGLELAGIAAVAIDAEMPAHPFTEEALAHARRLGLPVLQTALEVPFVSLAMAIAEAAQREHSGRVERTERLYAILGGHAAEDPVEALLDELGEVLHTQLTLHPRASQAGPEELTQLADGSWVAPLSTAGAQLHATSGPLLERPLLQHTASIVTNALAVKVAARRNDWLHGSLLLADLCDESVTSAPAEHLVAAYAVAPPFLLAASQHPDPRAALDAVHAACATARVPALATTKDGQVLVLFEATEAVAPLLEALADAGSEIGVSGEFTELTGLHTALRQARSALIRAHQSGRVLHFEEHEPTSLFLPNDPEQLRGIARQVLGPLRTYDEQRGTSLTHTLRIFLEENRSWVRASERLFVHRQTLIARISRIEKIIARDLSSMEDTAECWLAVQAAISCGDLSPSDPTPEATSTG